MDHPQRTFSAIRAQEIFFAALEKTSPSDRAAFLDVECAGDPMLRRWVENELRKQTGIGDFLSQTAVGSSEPGSGESQLSPEIRFVLAALKPEEPGDRIGPYKLVEQLGEGGFGMVWMAEQERPVRREVALKILKPGMDSRQIIGRFEQERQTLARLDHPGVAKVFDAGATATGRPFFAMELVRGKPITDYCDEARLPIRQRLELFMRVCFAVQHAHQKGIIHRDIKPSNILVSDHEGVSVPKLIDLGLAKVTMEIVSEHTLVVTQAERMIGTPLYMSPEQAEGSADIDTRTDIYALGAVLYELLTGRTPHDPNEMAHRSHDEIRRAIREQDAPRPSSALRSMSAGALSAMAQLSGTDATQLVRTVRGELDAICMKALEKDRLRRYSSAASLASDIQSYLLNEPISARAPSQWYRARKFATRNRRSVVAVVVVAAAIVIAGGVSIREALKTKAAEQSALDSRTLESQQRERAERERYVAGVALAQQSLAGGNLGRAVQLLDKLRPAPGETDYRGWGWRYLWQLAQGDNHAEFPDHPGPAGAVAFSPAGDRIAIGGQQETTICDVRTRSLVATLPQAADALAFLADGRTLVTFSKGRLFLWNTTDWTEHSSWVEGPGPFTLSPDGMRLAVVCREGVRIRDTQTWQETRLFTGAKGPLAFSPDGASLAVQADGGITVWALDGSGSQVMADSANLFTPGGNLFFQPSQALSFAAGGGMLVALQNNPSERGVFLLRIWDARSGKEEAVLPEDPERPEHTGGITSLAVSRDGNTLATTSLDHSVRLWDLSKRRRIAVLQGHRAEVGGAAFSPDGQTLVTSDRAGQVKEWTVRREKSEEMLSEAIRPLSFSADGRTLAALTTDDEVVFYEASTRQPQRRFALNPASRGHPPTIAISGDLGTLAQGLMDGRVKLWNTGTGETRVIEVSERAVDVIALTPDGQTLVTGSRSERLRARDLRTNEETELPFGASRVLISPDGRTLAAFDLPALPPDAQGAASVPGGRASDRKDKGDPRLRRPRPPSNSVFPPTSWPNDSLVLWDLPGGTLKARLAADMGVPLDAAFSPDSRTFAAAGTDNAIRLWNTTSGALMGICAGHKQIVRAVAFAYDGQTIATAGDDSTLRLWNVPTQQELLSFQDLGSNMTGLLFSPDNETLVVARTNRTQARGLLFHRAPQVE